MLKAVILKKAGNIKDIKLKISKTNRNKDTKDYFKKFKKYINDKSKYDIELIDIWTMNGSNLVGYGISKGKDNTLNRHELLSTTNNNKFYGDILLIKTNKDNTIEHLTSKEYENYYNKFYGYYNSEDEMDNGYNDSESNINLDEIDLSEDSDSSNTSYDEMYDSEEIKISDYETDNSDTEKEKVTQMTKVTKVTKKENNTSKIKQTYIKELEYESYSSESD